MKHTLFMLLLAICNVGFAQIREIPAPGLNDIAMASMDAYGPVIYYNPNVVQQVGPQAAAFFEAHEYGHHNLGHVTAGIYNANNPYVQMWLTLNAENEADAYAVRTLLDAGNTDAILAAYNAFIYRPNNGDRTHPPSVVRARNIAALYYNLTGSPLAY